MMRGYWFVVPAVLLSACGGRAGRSDSARADSARLESAAAAPVLPADSARARAERDTTPRRSGESTAAGSSRSREGQTTSRHNRPAASGGDSTVERSDAADTARGIVAVVGTSFDSHVILRQPGGARSVTLAGPQARTVGALSGADVWVSGTRDQSGRITVSRFVVRAVDGAPALDGTLIAHGQQLLLVTRDGKQHPIENPPPALRDHVGARIWVTGPLERGPITFGVIEERR